MTPQKYIDKLLRAAGPEVVLIGGQALAYWAQRYDVVIPADVMAISGDTDFLGRGAGDKDTVERLAKALHGKAHYPSPSALTSLVGQAHLDLSDDEFVNVDVVFKVIGMTPEDVRKRQVTVQLATTTFSVMHPLDVLWSRVANLYQLTEKQNDKGVMQLRLAVDVGRCFLQEFARANPSAGVEARSPLQPLVSEVERMAFEDAGSKVAQRWGVHVADAIDPGLISARTFWEKKWPDLSKLMSPDYAARFRPPSILDTFDDPPPGKKRSMKR